MHELCTRFQNNAATIDVNVREETKGSLGCVQGAARPSSAQCLCVLGRVVRCQCQRNQRCCPAPCSVSQHLASPGLLWKGLLK